MIHTEELHHSLSLERGGSKLKNIFSKKSEDYTVIVGCGRLGANLANTLSDSGGDIIVIDKNADAFIKLSPSYGASRSRFAAPRGASQDTGISA